MLPDPLDHFNMTPSTADEQNNWSHLIFCRPDIPKNIVSSVMFDIYAIFAALCSGFLLFWRRARLALPSPE